MEETIGYEAVFSPEEWDSINLANWSELTDEGGAGPTVPSVPHPVTIYNPPGQHAGNEKSYEIECEHCGEVGTADDFDTAQVIANLHENLVARAIEAVEVIR